MTATTKTRKAIKKATGKATANAISTAKKAIHKAAPATKELDLAALETALVEKYPEARIVTGSYRLAGAKDGFAAKRSVTIECCVCNATRRIATSDVFQSLTCGKPECRKELKGYKKAEQEAGK